MASARVPSFKGDKVSVNIEAGGQPESSSPNMAARFRVSELLGEGGMGSVFVAHDRGLGRVVALKRLREGLEKDQGALRRFILEAQIGAQLEHPNIVPLYSFERSEGGAPAIAMQLLEGTSMSDYIRLAAVAPKEARSMRGEYSLKERIGTLLGVCEAIHFAHERGVIHRDLKPDNVMLGRFSEVYVMDWGLARVTAGAVDMALSRQDEGFADRATALPAPEEKELGTSATIVAQSTNPAKSATATRQGDVMGTPQYMPPEQALGLIDQVGPAADQYALGVMLQELTTLKPARSHTSTMQALTQALQNQLAPMIGVDGETPHPALQAIVARATQKNPEDRYLSVSDLTTDIRRFIRDEPVSVYREGLARRSVRVAARRPVLAMAILSVCGFLTSVGVVGAVIRDTHQVKRQARTLENTRKALVTVSARAHQVDKELSDIAAGVHGIAAAAIELLDRPTESMDHSGRGMPALAPSSAFGGAPASFEGLVMTWPGKASGAPPPPGTVRLEHLERWLRQALVNSLPEADRDGTVTAQNAAFTAGRAMLLRTFIGMEDGTFAQFPAREIPPHDPRKRPWYQRAVREPALHWTRPISDTTKRTVRISAVVGMRSRGQLVGVAGCDVRVSALAPRLKLDLPGFRRGYLVTEDGKIAVSEDLEKAMLAKVTNPDQDLELPPVDDKALAEVVSRGEHGGYIESGDRLLVYARLISPPWTYVAELEKARYLER